MIGLFRTMNSRLTVSLFTALTLLLPTVVMAANQPVTIWVTADKLLPGWGFYPTSPSYGGTQSLGRRTAWCAAGNSGRLTWVAEFPQDGEYQVWVRRYGGYGSVAAYVDDRPVVGARGGEGGARFVWNHVGKIKVKSGSHHVDLDVTRGMFDAVIFTMDARLDPAKDELPEPVAEPTLRALRSYRKDTEFADRAATHGFVMGRVTAYEQILYDWLPDPAEQQPLDQVQMWGAANQYINGTFAVRALRDLAELNVSLSRFEGPQQTILESSEIDVRVVHVRERKNMLFESSFVRVLTPEILLRDDRTSWPPQGKQGGYGGGQCVTRIPAHQSRQFWLTVHVPAGSPPGEYRGELVLRGDNEMRLPVSLEVLPIELLPAEGYYSIYHRSQSNDPEADLYVTAERYLAELQDHERHGLNAVTLYGGFSTLEMARQAGLKKPPCLMKWPDGFTAAEEVAAARKMGFEDLYYYGVDEPHTPAQIERCVNEVKRRQAMGLHMLTAINSKPAYQATRDFIDRPVYSIYVFGGPNNAEVMYVREKGFRPISYWLAGTTYPLPYRALTGLYNKACGYLGSSPWAYQHFPDDRLYDPDVPEQKVTYPDQFGQPIPTLAWEAHRAGIDDVRYLEALDRAMAAADLRLKQPQPPANLEKVLAEVRQVRKQHYESISGRWFEYFCRLRPGDLAQTRRVLAEAIVQLTQVGT